MSFPKYILIILSFSIFPLYVIAAEPDFDLKQEIHDLVYNAPKKPTEIAGLQMVLIKNGQVIFEYAQGMATITENGTTPLTVNHKVRIASISKFVLTMAFMSLVDEGKVDLDGDVSKYIGFELRNPNYPDRKITPRHILAHVSSIRDASYYYLDLNGNYRDFFRPNNEHYENGDHFASGLNKGPGDYFTYSNLNFGIIAGIVENLSGKRMDQYVKQKIFDPLGLKISYNVCDLYENNFKSVATLFRRGDGGETWNPEGPWIEQVDGQTLSCFYGSPRINRTQTPDLSMLDKYNIGQNPTLFSPQGGLRASAKDLSFLMLALLNKGQVGSTQIMSEKAINQMMTPVWQYDENLKNGHTGGEAMIEDARAAGMMTRYGLSTHIIDLKEWGLTKESHILYGHLGSAYGLQGQFWFDPKTKDGMIAFVTGLGDNPDKADKTIPLLAIEEAVLKLGLKGLKIID